MFITDIKKLRKTRMGIEDFSKVGKKVLNSFLKTKMFFLTSIIISVCYQDFRVGETTRVHWKFCAIFSSKRIETLRNECVNIYFNYSYVKTYIKYLYFLLRNQLYVITSWSYSTILFYYSLQTLIYT